MKKYIVIAGVNGAGKSTLYRMNKNLADMPRVNVDEIVKERVQYRVEQGGHGIPETDIEKRYEETFEQLNDIYKECDLVAFYDNTEIFRRFAICKKGEIVRLSHNVPEWFSRVER